jgi:hypothetical protein
MLGAAARADVVPQFGLEQMVMRIEALYEDAVRESARACGKARGRKGETN